MVLLSQQMYTLAELSDLLCAVPSGLSIADNQKISMIAGVLY